MSEKDDDVIFMGADDGKDCPLYPSLDDPAHPDHPEHSMYIDWDRVVCIDEYGVMYFYHSDEEIPNPNPDGTQPPTYSDIE